jgi:hypothetical protein
VTVNLKVTVAPEPEDDFGSVESTTVKLELKSVFCDSNPELMWHRLANLKHISSYEDTLIVAASEIEARNALQGAVAL